MNRKGSARICLVVALMGVGFLSALRGRVEGADRVALGLSLPLRTPVCPAHSRLVDGVSAAS